MSIIMIQDDGIFALNLSFFIWEKSPKPFSRDSLTKKVREINILPEVVWFITRLVWWGRISWTCIQRHYWRKGHRILLEASVEINIATFCFWLYGPLVTFPTALRISQASLEIKTYFVCWMNGTKGDKWGQVKIGFSWKYICMNESNDL